MRVSGMPEPADLLQSCERPRMEYESHPRRVRTRCTFAGVRVDCVKLFCQDKRLESFERQQPPRSPASNSFWVLCAILSGARPCSPAPLPIDRSFAASLASLIASVRPTGHPDRSLTACWHAPWCAGRFLYLVEACVQRGAASGEQWRQQGSSDAIAVQ